MSDVKQKRELQRIEHVVEPAQMKLSGTAVFWKSVIHSYIELEIIPHLYTYHLHHASREETQEIVATNGTTVIYATVTATQIVLTEALSLNTPMSKERALSHGYEWYRTTLALWIDKHYYFLKAYQKKRFDLSLIVPAYHKAKALMPNDRLAVNDGDSRVLIAKKDGSTLVLLTGMRRGDKDWERFAVSAEG